MTAAQHGTRSKYVAGCRCEPCTVASREYNREWQRHQRRVAYGIEEAREAFVDATEAREHLRWLRSQGVGMRAVCDATGLSRSALQKIVTGKRTRITPRLADKILAVPRGVARPAAVIDATETWRLIDDLIYLGYPKVRIAKALGQRGPGLQVGRDRVLRRTADRIAEIHRSWRHCWVGWHGTLEGYAKHGCRCLACKRASAEQRARFRPQQDEVA